MVIPQAHYDRPDCDGILVLQRGENASTDYYLRTRLEATQRPHLITDLDADPEDCPLLKPEAARSLMVVFCRYAARPWLAALAARRDRLARVAFFMDDDLPLMMRDPSLPRSVRGKAALHFGAHVQAISRLASEVWVSSPALAERYAEARPSVLRPLPEADSPPPEVDPPRRVVYHGTDVHPQERLFVLEIARQLAGTGLEFEITGGPALVRAAGEAPGVTIAPQLPWPQYLRRQAGMRAALSLAPLFPSPLNVARAPVKAFDAARLGAAGLYADVEPYRSFVRHGEDGLLLAMEPQDWADAIAALMHDPQRRLKLAQSARARLVALRRSDSAFPTPPGA